MIETPSPSNVRSDSKRRNGRSNRSAVRSDHVLEFDDTAVHESNGLVWVLHGWRDVRIEKGIVKRIAKDDEAMSMMAAKYADTAAPEAGITIAVWPITAETPVTVAPVTVAVGIGTGGGVVDPGFSDSAAGVAVNLLFGSPPGEPDRIRRHSTRNLALSDELLLASRQAVVEIAMV